MKVRFKTQGFREMDAALGELKKATAKNVLRRAGIAALEPVAEVWRAKAPVDDVDGGQLRDSIAVSTKLNKRQKRMNRNPSVVEIYVGPSGAPNAPPQGVQQEFGNENHGPQPSGRPAWDAEGGRQTLDRLAVSLGAELDKAAARARKRALKVK